ncbi:hypothetical protein [Vibrio mediterranei]|uniref:Uncharacterized protein n=1 Tax=Vibrio mediterranei TaxID=689 RepID=A0AAN1FL23_9VIBR|nr:hypothetical protein [Vibrio mediterranei]ASI92605.1 hypothetical protein BSZ05_22740 [Vibrio mediterranei]
MNLKKLEELDVGYIELEPSIERSVRCTWALNMYLQHVLRSNLSDSLVEKINQINESLGVEVHCIDLNDYKHDFITSTTLNKLIEENEYPKFLWFYSAEALKDSYFAGWLRSKLTVRAFANLRVVFVIESRQVYREVFCDRRARLYQSTIPIQTKMVQKEDI